MHIVQVKIWFQNRRARERRGKDSAMMSGVAAVGGAVGNGVEDRNRSVSGGIGGAPAGLLSGDDAEMGELCCGATSPFDDRGGHRRAGLTPPEKLLSRSEVVVDPRRYAVAAAMMRACTLDYCRPPSSSSWEVGIPRHHRLMTSPVTSLPVPAAAAAADLLAHLSSSLGVGAQLSSASSAVFSPSPINILRF